MDGRAVRNHVSRYLSAMDFQTSCALFVIRIGRLDEIYNTLGQQVGDQEIYRIGQTLSLSFRATDIVGRTGRDEFAVFISGAITRDRIREKAAVLKWVLEENAERETGWKPDIYIGICIAAGEGIHFDDLYGTACRELEESQNSKEKGYQAGIGEIHTQKGNDGRLYSTSLLDAIHILPLLEFIEEGVGLISVGENIQVLYLNPAYRRIRGMEGCEEPLPCLLEEIGIHPDDAVSYEDILREGGRNGRVIGHIHRIAAKNGSWRWIRTRAVRIACQDRSDPIVLETASDITEVTEKDTLLREVEERLRVVMKQVPYKLWEVDVPKKLYRAYDCQSPSGEQGQQWKAFPDYLIQNGIVASNSAVSFRQFAERLLEGRTQGSGNFIMRNSETGSFGWNSLSYHMIFDETGSPLKAVGLNGCNSLLSESQMQMREKRFLPDILRYSLLGRIRVNLTKDLIEELWLEGNDLTGTAGNQSYTQYLAVRQKEFCPKEHEKGMLAWTGRTALLDDFHRGKRWFTKDFYRIDRDGRIRWTSAVVNLFKKKTGEEIGALIFLRDIDQKRRWEQEWRIRPDRDPVTGLYSSRTLQKLAENLINADIGTTCGAAVIRIIGIPQGEELTEIETEKRRAIAVTLSLSLGTDECLGQYQEDLFVAFFPNIDSENGLKKRLEEAFYYVRVLLSDTFEMRSLRFVAGVSCQKTEEADFQVLSAYAAHLADTGVCAASDSVVLQGAAEDWQRQTEWGNSGKGVLIRNEDMEKPLSAEEQSVAFNCVAAMLTSKSLDASIESVLRYIGIYYQASRVYILALSESGKTVTMMYEWTEIGKNSIRRAMSGVPIVRFPVLVRCMNEKTAVTLENSRESGFGAGQTWHYTACPLKGDGGIEGFLCIENSREHPAEVALLGTLIPYILKEQKRFENTAGKTEPGGRDSLTGMGNLRTYLDFINSIDSDTYTTLGVITAEIPNLSYINSTLGFAYGKELLLYVSDTLAGIFRRAFLFRTWDAEFVVLCPNMTHEAFIGKCTQVRLMLQKRYPNKIRIGYTWSDRIFTGRELVREAAAIMRCEKVPKEPGSMEELLEEYGEKLAKEASNSRFVAYFQPKIDMKTGRLVGAEALVRRVDQSGKVVFPADFIQEMEKDGSIRELDFYMMEWTLTCMEKWREKGLTLVPISVNFSRITFLSPTAPASVLALKSRYPGLTEDLLEIEITETAGDVEAATLSRIIENFRKFGMRFALDDFGSHYSNLSIFSHVRFDEIKLDRSMIKDLPENAISQAMVRDLVKICQDSGIVCVAEGVETEAQKAALLEAGCVYAQGYYYDAPLSAEAFEEKYLKNRRGK